MTVDPSSIRAPCITQQDAWIRADDIRGRYWPSDVLPVEPELIALDMCLDIALCSAMRTECDTDALLANGATVIFVDAEDYMDDCMQTRMRFSIAHEIGHYVLHREIYADINFKSVDEWIDFRQRIPDRELGFIEQQAYEFAGRLLVPSDRLAAELKIATDKARASGFNNWDASGDVARGYVANSICPIFGVSVSDQAHQPSTLSPN